MTKKKPAWHVKVLEEPKSGSKVTKAEGGSLLTAIIMNVCSIIMAIANPTNALAAHNNGIFPLPLYRHSYRPSFLSIHVIYNVISHRTKKKRGHFHNSKRERERVIGSTTCTSERVASAIRQRMKQNKPQRMVRTMRRTPSLLPKSVLRRLGARSACVTAMVFGISSVSKTS